jgi:hypothetical protein
VQAPETLIRRYPELRSVADAAEDEGEPNSQLEFE